ncbi:hypothetical protein VTN02DRAFT_6106 [Thermoascus thermophilus]
MQGKRGSWEREVELVNPEVLRSSLQPAQFGPVWKNGRDEPVARLDFPFEDCPSSSREVFLSNPSWEEGSEASEETNVGEDKGPEVSRCRLLDLLRRTTMDPLSEQHPTAKGVRATNDPRGMAVQSPPADPANGRVDRFSARYRERPGRSVVCVSRSDHWPKLQGDPFSLHRL